MYLKEPVRITRSTYSVILWAIAVALLLIFGFYIYIIDHAELLQGSLGLIMIAIGVVFFVAEFFLIRFFLKRNTQVGQPSADE